MKHFYVRRIFVLSVLGTLVLSALALLPAPARAVEVPPAGTPIFIQTNGPQADIALGDWYTSENNGINGGYHYFSITVPCRWPADLDLDIDLYSPEINTFVPPPRPDEVESEPLNNTIFELYGIGTAMNLPREPGPRAPGSLLQQTFTPVADRPEQWDRFYTLAAPVRCGTYLLRAETEGDEQNGWRVRFGSDNDDDPTNPMPPNYDNPDGRPGSGDEPIVGVIATTYQHNQVDQVQCLTLYQFVRPNLPEVSFHNFDLDSNERVRYYPPSSTYDSNGAATPGSIAGTVSPNRRWNNGTTTDRGAGDVIPNPEPGWWRIVTCVQDDNQFNQEGQAGIPTFRQPSPEPDMLVSKDDGRTIITAGEILTYTITYTNQALLTKPEAPGAAFDVVLTDTLPINATFRSCRLVTPNLAGSCEQQGGNVIFTLDDPVFAGDSGELEVSVAVNGDAQDRVVNTVILDYTDLLSNPYPTERAEDIDLIVPGPLPVLSATKSARLKTDRNADGKASPGDVIAYTIRVHNAGPGDALEVRVTDTPDPNTTLLVGTVAAPEGAVLSGNNEGDTTVAARFARIVTSAEVELTFDVQVNEKVPPTVTEIVNQGLVCADNTPCGVTDDPDDPEPGDETEVPYVPPGGGPPTAIQLRSFTAIPLGRAVLVRWSTGAEINSVGFHLYRATSDRRAEATRITPAMIPARGGPTSGADYLWIDTDVSSGVSYNYWLVETERSRTTNEYGPASTMFTGAAGTQIYLPLLVR